MCLSKKEKVIVKLFKHEDSIEICLLKKSWLWNFLNLKIPTNVFMKKIKGYCETFSTQYFYRNIFFKKKVIVKVFKRKDSIEICCLKKRLLWNFLNVKIPTKYVY